MHTILYLGSSTDLSYEQELLDEWGKHVRLASVSELPCAGQLAATGTDDALPQAAPDPLQDIEAVVIEHGELGADELRAHPSLSVVVLLSEQDATVDVEAATAANVWVTRAANRVIARLPFASGAPSHATRRHALQDALAGISGERPSGRINEL